MLHPFLHIDVAPVEHKSPIPHSEVKAEALQFSPEASDLQLFDLTTAHMPPCSGSSSVKGIWRSFTGTPNVIWIEHGGPWCGGLRNHGVAVLECQAISHWLTTLGFQTHVWGASALPATNFTHPALQCLISRKPHLIAGRRFLTEQRKRWTIKPCLTTERCTLLGNGTFYMIFLFLGIIQNFNVRVTYSFLVTCAPGVLRLLWNG